MKKQKTILCYGDSNTWGFVPGKLDLDTFYMERYARDVRWTGLLQRALGDSCYVVEEGLNGRTTNVDYKDVPNRNGKTYLEPCLYSHSPLDLVILSLGCNDMKIEFNRDAKAIADGLSELVDLIQGTKYGADMQSSPKILIVSYGIPVNECLRDLNNDLIFKGSIEKSKQLSEQYAKVAKKKQCYFLDIAPHITFSGIDGIHLDEGGHKQLAGLITKEVKQILSVA
jgi:lysophospholipase L1-like esterase